MSRVHKYMGGALATGAKQLQDRVASLLEPAVTAAGFDLEEVAISRAGARSVVRVVVDRDGGIDLDAVAVASRAISDVLDADEDMIPGAYALEVTSPGVDRPLTAPRHWRRNRGRLVQARRHDGTQVTGRITEADEDVVTLDVDGRPERLALAEVSRAVVQVEFSRPATGGTEPEDLVEDDDTDIELDEDDEQDDA